MSSTDVVDPLHQLVVIQDDAASALAVEMVELPIETLSGVFDLSGHLARIEIYVVKRIYQTRSSPVQFGRNAGSLFIKVRRLLALSLPHSGDQLG